MNSDTSIYSRKLVWLLTAGAFYAFFVFGFVDNLKGPTLPSVLDDFSLSYGQGGTIFFGAYLGFLIATLLTGMLADLAGNKAVLIVAGVCLTLGIAAYSFASTYWMLAAAMVVLGLGLGATEVGGNGLIVDIHSRNRGRYLNLLAMFHGVGSLVVPLYVAVLLQNLVGWRHIYRFTLVLVILYALFFIVVRYPRRRTSDGGGLDLQEVRRSGFTRQMVWFYLLIGVYVAVEIGVAAWIVVFLQQNKGLSVGQGALYLSLFFGFIMIGRLVGSFFVERIGYLRVMLFAMICAALSLSIGIFGPPLLAIFISLSGLFLSIVFPTTTAAVAEFHSENTGSILGLLFAFAGVGGMIGPWAVGVLSDQAGLQIGFALNILYCLIAVLTLIVLRRLLATT